MDRLLEYLDQSLWRGAINRPTHVGFSRNPLCGDEVWLDLEVVGGSVRQARFHGQGCVVSQACASMLCEEVDGNLTPDGDIYTALDRFGRMKQSLWNQGSTALSNVQYGYDRASNRTWRQNPIATANSAQYDWLYGYDGLQRLKNGGRGTLNASATGLTAQTFAQCWTLDETGNWSGFKQSDNGATWTLEQTRTANTVNELTTINASVGEQWANPGYDANGNMTSIPRPGLNRPSWANLTTDQWSALTVDDWSRMEVAPTLTATFDAWNRLVKLR